MHSKMPQQSTHLIVYDAVMSGRNLLKFRKICLLRSCTEKLWQYFPGNVYVYIFPGGVAQRLQGYTVSKTTKP
jgi:hypothetical protein